MRAKNFPEIQKQTAMMPSHKVVTRVKQRNKSLLALERIYTLVLRLREANPQPSAGSRLVSLNLQTKKCHRLKV